MCGVCCVGVLLCPCGIVDSVLGLCESSFGRGAGEWLSGAGDVVLRPSGWGGWVELVAGDGGDGDEWRACGCG